jgi:beta-lactam-binding protein with PASTA domain
MNETLKRIWKSVYFRHAVAAIMLICLLLYLSSIFLDAFTRHGKSSPTPDMTGKSVKEAQRVADSAGLRIEVTDSVNRHDIPRGSVYMQNPEPGILVKKNRKIFLSINSVLPTKSKVPSVEHLSLRNAKADLNAKGFRVGKLIYISGYNNHVYKQMYRGHRIDPDTELEVGEYIDLQLGSDTTSNAAAAPNVAGMVRARAEDAIIENSLNYSFVFDKNVKTYIDSIEAVAYSQDPEAGTKLKSGAGVKVMMRLPKRK